MEGRNPLRADLIMRSHNLIKYVDVKVCSPCSASALGPNAELPPVAGKANDLGEKAKMSLYVRHYGDHIKSRLIPFVLETSGGLGPVALSVVDELAKLYREDPEVFIADDKLKKARKFFMLRLGVLLTRGNATVIRQFRHNRDLDIR